MKKLLFPLILIALAGALIGLFALGGGRGQKPEEKQIERIGQQVELIKDTSHVPVGTEVKYNSNPPSSGQHYDKPDEAGIKEGEIDDRTAVHNLEHGYIWITYRPCSDQIKTGCLDENQTKDLKLISRDLPGDPLFNSQKFILSPRSRNERAITLVAWGYLYHLDTPDAEIIKKFYDGHVNQAPEKLP